MAARSNKGHAGHAAAAQASQLAGPLASGVLLALAGTLPPAAVPSTLVIDREGRVAARTLGPVDYSGLLGMIEPVQAEKG